MGRNRTWAETINTACSADRKQRLGTEPVVIYPGATLSTAGLLAMLPEAEHAALGARVGELPGK